MKYNSLGAMASVAVLLSVTACSSVGDKSTGVDVQDQFKAREAALAQRELQLKARESELASKASMPAPAPMSVAGHGDQMLPPGAKAGQCFTRVWMPPEYKTVQERKLVSEASERIEIIPAKYKPGKRRVLVQEASTKLVTVPATYKTVTERVLVEPERTVVEEVPAQYSTESERILDKPAHTIWKKGAGPIQRIDASTGEIMCLVEVPATYKTISKRVLKKPATTRTRTIPAVYKTVKKRVVATDATTRTVEIPAKYSNVTVTEEVRPMQEKRIPIAAKYTKVTRRELVRDGRMDWREILCETNTTPDRVMKIQKALKAAGYNPGAVDGRIGGDTMSAVNAFQRAKGLPVDKYLNVKTVRALGVSVR